MAVNWRRFTGDHELAAWWHASLGLLYAGALFFHVLSAVQHWRDRPRTNDLTTVRRPS